MVDNQIHTPVKLGRTVELLAPALDRPGAVLVDAGGWGIGPDGKPHPIDPWGPLFAKLLTTMGILSLSTNMDRKLQEAARKLAAEHLDTIKESILAAPAKTKSK